MLFSMGVALYTSRIVLATLGIEDFGIYNVIGGVVIMMSVLNSSMSIAVQRFLAFELGQNNELQLKKTFNISLFTHAVIAVIVLIIAETAGLWFVSTQLNIPDNRMYAAIWVFHLSVFSCLLSILQVPFTAAIISNEKMGVYAYLGILDVVLRLLIAYILIIGSFDKLILYGFLTLGTTFLILLIHVFYCKKHFPETRFHFVWDGDLFKKIISFSGWNLFYEFAWVAVSQGINILLNIFFGPAVNAAKAISNQVNVAIRRFSVNFQTALKPQIIKTYASDDLSSMFNLLYRGSRFSFYLLFFISLPVLLETEYILNLWLVDVPEYTVIFCRLIIIHSLITVMSNLLGTAVSAHGNIKRYKIFTSLTFFINLPISYFILKQGGSPEITLYVYVFISICQLFVRLFEVKRLINLSIRQFIKEVVLNIAVVSVISMIVPLFYQLISSFGGQRFVISTILSILSVALTVYFLGLKKSERVVIIGYMGQKIGNYLEYGRFSAEKQEFYMQPKLSNTQNKPKKKYLWTFLLIVGLGTVGYFTYPSIQSIIEKRDTAPEEALAVDTLYTEFPHFDDEKDIIPQTQPIISQTISGNYFVIVASLPTYAEAERHINMLQRRATGHSFEIIDAGNQRFRISAGSFDDLAEAQRQMEQIRTMAWSPRDIWIWIVRQ